MKNNQSKKQIEKEMKKINSTIFGCSVAVVIYVFRQVLPTDIYSY